MRTKHTAIVSTQSETRIIFGANSVLFRQKEAILGRFEAGCLPAYIQLADIKADMGHHFQESVNRLYLFFLFFFWDWGGLGGRE